MKVYTIVGSLIHVLHPSELWTVQLGEGKDYSEKDAREIVREFKELKPTAHYWAGADVPEDYPVQPILPGQTAIARTTCGHCGLSWDDAVVTSITPVPGARCPFEPFHIHEDEP